MHYNQFTIDYIEKIKSNLKININTDGEAAFFPDFITDHDVDSLRFDLTEIWNESHKAVDIIHRRHDAVIQSGLFGLVNGLEKAIKIGFLLGDRVVIVDYLFERILQRKATESIDRVYIRCYSCRFS